MKEAHITVLGYALLGLLHLKPQSGYDLRKTFAQTAMGTYSSSPGAIYPALERLERDKLIVGRVQDSAGLRRRRMYRPTEAGVAALKRWLTGPITDDDVKRGEAELMLRFSFMEHTVGAEACMSFLVEFGGALKPYIAGLKAFLSTNAAVMPLSARLALESGIRGYETLGEWTEYALRAYRKSESANQKLKSHASKGGAQ